MKKVLWLLLLLSLPALAQQGGGGIVLQSGNVTTNNCAKWAGNGKIADSGGTCGGGGGSGLSGMTAGQVPIAATASTVTSSTALQGTDTKILTAGTVSGTGATLCTSANGGATTSGCVSGGLVLLQALTASTSAELDFTSCLSSTYDEYEIHFINLIPTTNLSANTVIQFSTNGGTSYDSTAANYEVHNWRWWAANSSEFDYTSVDGIYLTNNLSTTVSFGGFNGMLRLFSPLSTTVNKRSMGTFTLYDGNLAKYMAVNSEGTYANTAAVNAFRVIMDSSQTIASGTVRCYGVSH